MKAARHQLLYVILALPLGGCASNTGDSTLPSASGNDQAGCRQVARNYINTHSVDRLWREHEQYRQYRLCMHQKTSGVANVQ